jgi:hypothetical protein
MNRDSEIMLFIRFRKGGKKDGTEGIFEETYFLN